ncbi:GYF domain-containing protein mpd2 [Elsinoe australis]|uniref:GYF domain-containing protein mpd2 n=1 Tax=Elsinoe australis TaxID=40998 RepID=A0A2P7YJP6_9PEZI|nr:GYF domain-containing protein mpd2 [Elsinoe australis]
MAPSTFASAAAGSNQNSSTARQEGGSEWPRRTNGATQTFRRPSLATSHSQSNSIHQRDTSLESQPARYVPPHRNGTVPESRYPKEQLIDLFKTQNNTDNMSRDSLTSLFVAGWEPEQFNGFSDGSSGWAVRDAHRDGQAGPEAFWSNEGSMLPLGLVEMTEEEKEAFSTSVNSPIKPMNTATREGQGREGMPLRKISISQNPNSPGLAMNSPSATRTGRRREASESYPFPTNPLASPKPRDENRTTSPPPALRRRTTGFKDPDQDQKATEPEAMGGGGSGDASKQPGLAQPRIAANPLSAGLGGPASPWGTVQPSPGFAPMGSFGSFASGTPTAAPGEKRPGFGSGRAESRFKGLMSKDSHDDIGKTLKEKSSLSNFGKPADNTSWRTGWGEQGRSSMEQEHEGPSGSAALGGGEEISPPPIRGLHDLGTPHRPDHREEFGFSAWTPETGIKGFSHDQQHDQQSRGPQHVHQAMSPTNTNPYQSPQQGHAEADDLDTDDSELQNLNIPGLRGLMNDELGPMPGHFGGFSSFSQAPGDRSATSSAGPNRAFPGLSGLGALPGLSGSAAWGGLPATSATPTRAHGGFGDSMFGSAADLQSPSLAGLGPSSFFGSSQSAAPGAGRGMSRMGSLFQQSGPTGMGAGDASRTAQEDEESVPAAPGLNDDTSARGFPQQSESRQSLDIPSGASQTSLSQQQPIGSSGNNQPPTAQQKTMVMPDRMRWIYRDPSGNTQGPWTGLEMHDWYKAGFFSPELLVKKAEDPDYEPLAQLIRRIGNSREPFLVPQIGIPHGTPQSNWGATGPLTGPTTTGQPPFAASFPSFGTTLTAEQQNALERRKQEEQYLMARQKEHLAQQQMAQRLQISGQHGLLPHQLQHHPSAQSLHSQPSFGSIASGPGFQASPMHAPTPGQAASGGFDSQFGAQNRGFGAVGAGASASAGLGALREEELNSAMNELGINQQQRETSGAPGQPFPQQSQQQQQGQYEQDIHEQQAKLHEQQVKLILEDNIRLQRGQDAAQQAHHEQHFSGERLEEFQKLQQQHQFDDQQAQQHYQQGQDEARERLEQAQQEAYAQAQRTPVREPKSLTEQVQQAVSAKQSPAQASPWGKVDPALPQPFPPAPSQSPLPAPAAQRNRSHVADALHAESHSRSQSPSVDTPSASIAPWAKEPAEAPRGPSLKEIQEAEAKNAAKAEALAADARRQALEREALAQMQAAAAASTSAGLPSSATWATAGGASPSAASTASAWAKAAKPVAGPTSAKSMAQIQKEEEARKKRLVAAAAQAQQNAALAGAAAQVQGKRYAELAGKVASGAPASPVAPQGSSAWTTVGAGGKTKAPLSPATAPPVRSASTTTTPLAAPALKKPTMPRTTTASNTAAVNAQEEFKRWAAGELRGDLKPGTTAEEFVTNLLAFPPEADIITEAVHSVSNTIDSRHFAEEFMRRRKMADKGIFDASSLGKSASPANGDAGRNGGGWSEVAKKGGKEAATPKENDLAGNFKVVAAKKKTKR